MKDEILSYLNAEVYELGASEVIASFAAALLMGLLIFTAYKFCYSGATYNGRFNVSLVMLTLITTLVMGVIGNNIALSLGMVGALSIVRFRTAIKDPRDTTYIFWCIAVGIACGVQSFLLVFVGSAVIFFTMLLLSVVKSNDKYLLIVEVAVAESEQLEKEINIYYNNKATLSVQNINGETTEYIYETTERLAKKCQKKTGKTIANYLSDRVKVNRLSLVLQSDEMSR